MGDLKTQAQAFMNTHKLKECFECDGHIFKHKQNAEVRKTTSGKEVITHTANAGSVTPKPQKEETQS